ncbi:MAG: hypothetical protein KDA71_21415 [Planctomycetales bacterium]|nr:hypothetical protein [Planctomycetales bacterium]
MLRVLITTLTIAAVAWHALAGCCGHHSEACATRTESAMRVIFAEPVGGNADLSCDHHEHGGGGVQATDGADRDSCCACQAHDHSHPHRCGESQCSFASVERADRYEVSLPVSWHAFYAESPNLAANSHRPGSHPASTLDGIPWLDRAAARSQVQVWRL